MEVTSRFTICVAVGQSNGWIEAESWLVEQRPTDDQSQNPTDRIVRSTPATKTVASSFGL